MKTATARFFGGMHRYCCGARRAEGGGRSAEGGGRSVEGGGRSAEGGGRSAEGGGRSAEGGARSADSSHGPVRSALRALRSETLRSALRALRSETLAWSAPAGHGLDDLRVDEESDVTMLAFLHVAEKEAAARFAIYRDAVRSDPSAQAIFEEILRDEAFHMNYTLTQLVRVSQERHRVPLWSARLKRIWKSYLRIATALAGAIGTVLLTIQYFVIVPLFALLAKRAERREPRGWHSIPPERNESLTRQY